MADDKVHKPSLPGVKTYAKDVKHGGTKENLGVSFIKAKEERVNPKIMHAPEKTVATGKDDALDVSQAFESGVGFGTIITDKKERHTKFGSVVKGAFGEWFGNIKSKVQALEMLQEEEKPTMAPVENRKEVISEAGKHTQQAPRDDHGVVVEKLKAQQHDAEKMPVQPILVREKTEAPAPSWTHTLNENADATPAGEGARDVPEAGYIRGVHDFRDDVAAPRLKPEATKQFTAHTTPLRPAGNAVEKKQDAVRKSESKPQSMEGVFKGATVSTLSTETKKHLEEAQEPSVKRGRPLPSGLTDDFFTQQEERPPKSPMRNEQRGVRSAVTVDTFSFPGTTQKDGPRGRSPFQSTPLDGANHKKETAADEPAATTSHSLIPHLHLRKLHAIMLAVVIAIGSIAGAGAAFYIYKSKPAVDATQTEAVIPSFFATDAATPVHLSTDRAVFMNALNEAVLRAQGRAVQFYPVTTALENPNVVIATAEEIFAELAPHANGAFVRALEEEMMLGVVQTTTKEPFIIIRSFNFDTAFAGMLSWEPSMAADLTPFFDTRTLTEAMEETGITPGAGGFVDATRQNRNIRILYDRDGNERIIYAFVSRDTIVITESADALSALIDRLR